jgi:hypothetical protein
MSTSISISAVSVKRSRKSGRVLFDPIARELEPRPSPKAAALGGKCGGGGVEGASANRYKDERRCCYRCLAPAASQ